jgi:hypothetical protein
MRTMDVARLQALERIDLTPLAPWRTPAFTQIDIKPDKEKARKRPLQAEGNRCYSVL